MCIAETEIEDDPEFQDCIHNWKEHFANNSRIQQPNININLFL